MPSITPRPGKQIFTDEGKKCAAFVNVYLNDEDVRTSAKDATAAGAARHHFVWCLHCGRTPAPLPWRRVRLTKDEILALQPHLILPESAWKASKS